MPSLSLTVSHSDGTGVSFPRIPVYLLLPFLRDTHAQVGDRDGEWFNLVTGHHLADQDPSAAGEGGGAQTHAVLAVTPLVRVCGVFHRHRPPASSAVRVLAFAGAEARVVTLDQAQPVSSRRTFSERSRST